MINGKAYPPAAKFEIPGLSWLGNLLGGKGGNGSAKGKEEL